MALFMPNFELREGRVSKDPPGILVIDERYELLFNKTDKEKNKFLKRPEPLMK